MAQRRPDPVRLEVFHQLLAALCEEAGGLLQRSAVSPNIRERRDFSFALFDGEGRLAAQAAHIPVHLGSAADSVAAVREALDLAPGDVALLNDPYAGGTHLPDVTMVQPVFAAGSRRPAWFLVNRAHHADVGGSRPGSMGVAHDLIAEGLVIPPVHLRRRGALQRDVVAMLRANVRGPDERVTDLHAQQASLERAGVRLKGLEEEHGRREVARYARHLMAYSERLVRDVLAGLPAGTYRARDAMADDGLGHGPFPIELRLGIGGRRIVFDFTRCAPQAPGGINANRSIVTAASVYALRCLCPERLPTNDGLFRQVEVRTREGTLLEPRKPAPVAGGNVETSQRLVDLALAALARACPGRIPAASAGTMSNLSLGGEEEGRPFAFYETLPGGAGAGPSGDGAAAVQTHMTNTRNTPVEELELRYPVRLRRFTLRRGSGGAGRHRGGDGLVKEIEARVPMHVSFLAERHDAGPAGRRGGRAGAPGALYRVRDGRRRRRPGKTSVDLAAGDAVIVATPGGGGYGRPRSR